MKLKQNYALREIAGELLLVPVGKASLNFNQMLTLNEVGADIWRLIPEADSEEEIVTRLLQEYEVDPEVLRADVAEFIESVRKLGIL